MTEYRAEVDSSVSLEHIDAPNAENLLEDMSVEPMNPGDFPEASVEDKTEESTEANIPTDLTDSRQLVTDFVNRLYETTLGRASDEQGLDDWVGLLADGEISAAKAAWGILEQSGIQQLGEKR